MSLESRLRMFLEGRIKDLDKDLQKDNSEWSDGFYTGHQDAFKFILEEFTNKEDK